MCEPGTVVISAVCNTCRYVSSFEPRWDAARYQVHTAYTSIYTEAVQRAATGRDRDIRVSSVESLFKFVQLDVKSSQFCIMNLVLKETTVQVGNG